MSKSATKAPRAGIGREEKRGISTILLARSGSIRAFVADLDKPGPPRAPAGGAGAPIGRAGPRERRSPMCDTPASGPRREGAVPPRNPEGYSGVVLKTWGVKIVVAVCSGHLRARRWGRARRDRPVRSSGAVRLAPVVRTREPGGSGGEVWGRRPAPLRLDSASRMVGRRLACRDAAGLLGPLACGWTTYVPLDHLVHEIRWSNRTQVVQRNLSGPSRKAPP